MCLLNWPSWPHSVYFTVCHLSIKSIPAHFHPGSYLFYIYFSICVLLLCGFNSKMSGYSQANFLIWVELWCSVWSCSCSLPAHCATSIHWYILFSTAANMWDNSRLKPHETTKNAFTPHWASSVSGLKSPSVFLPMHIPILAQAVNIITACLNA